MYYTKHKKMDSHYRSFIPLLSFVFDYSELGVVRKALTNAKQFAQNTSQDHLIAIERAIQKIDKADEEYPLRIEVPADMFVSALIGLVSQDVPSVFEQKELEWELEEERRMNRLAKQRLSHKKISA